MITRHPDTGRKVLYVISGFSTEILGLTAAESGVILDLPFRDVESNPQITCRVHWEPGTLTFWDDRCTRHHAIWDHFPRTRRGGRVSILGAGRPPEHGEIRTPALPLHVTV